MTVIGSVIGTLGVLIFWMNLNPLTTRCNTGEKVGISGTGLGCS